jgi:hypothetical protein
MRTCMNPQPLLFSGQYSRNPFHHSRHQRWIPWRRKGRRKGRRDKAYTSRKIVVRRTFSWSVRYGLRPKPQLAVSVQLSIELKVVRTCSLKAAVQFWAQPRSHIVALCLSCWSPDVTRTPIGCWCWNIGFLITCNMTGRAEAWEQELDPDVGGLGLWISYRGGCLRK